MSRSSLRPSLLALILICAASAATAEVRLDVGGEAQALEEGLMVRLEVVNRGHSAATRLEVEGELFGYHAEGTLSAGVAPGATESLWLLFPVEPPRPGVHPLALHLRYPVPGASEPASQRAYLLLALGGRSEPAVRLAVTGAAFVTEGRLPVGLESADGRPHRVRIRVLAPRGLNALAEPEVDVPATGTAVAQVPLIRVGPSRHARHGVVVLASAEVAGLQSTAAGTTVVDLVPERHLLPRLRLPLALAGGLLLAAAVLIELWRRLAPPEATASTPTSPPPPAHGGSSPGGGPA